MLDAPLTALVTALAGGYPLTASDRRDLAVFCGVLVALTLRELRKRRERPPERRREPQARWSNRR